MEQKTHLKHSISIVILNWNGKNYLETCLSSVLHSSYQNKHIIVVDNGSHDGSQTLIKKKFPQVTLLENKNNRGWSTANNRGIKYALEQGADCIMILNNDTRLGKETITILVNELYRNKKVGIVGPKILQLHTNSKMKIISYAGGYFTPNRYFGMHRGDGEIDTGKFNTVSRTEFTTGAAMVIKREVFKKIGYFLDDYFIYYEDAEFCIKARKAGYSVLYVPTATIDHMFSGTVEIGSPFQQYYTTRNHYLFVERNAPFSVKIREVLRTPKTLYEFLTTKDRNKRKYALLGVRDYYLRRFGKRKYW